MNPMGAGPADFKSGAFLLVSKGEVVGTNTGRQVGSPVPGGQVVSHLSSPTEVAMEAGGGRWGGIFYF